MKQKFSALLAVCVSLLLGACASAPQQPIQFDSGAAMERGRIGVVMTKLPAINTYTPGAGCLLCMAAASMANASLTEHAKSLPYDELPGLKNDIADALRKKGDDVRVIEEELNLDELAGNAGSEGSNVAKKDFAPVLKKFGVDKLLVVEISNLGFERTYSAYFPTSDPKGVFRGTGYIVNAKNTYEWYLPVQILKSADSQWDEAPKYPGLTDAYFQALELGRESFIKAFN